MVLKKLGCHEVDFDFERLIQFLCGTERKITPEGKRFYVGTVRERTDGHESKNAMSNQTALFTELWKLGWVTKTSKLRSRTERIKIDDRVQNHQHFIKLGIHEVVYERSREKGIDVKLAIDLLVGGIDSKYDTAIVVSSDTDLVPAVQWIRNRLRKKVEYVGFSLAATETFEATRPVKTMIYNTDVQRVLSESDVRPFIKPKLV